MATFVYGLWAGWCSDCGKDPTLDSFPNGICPKCGEKFTAVMPNRGEISHYIESDWRELDILGNQWGVPVIR